MLIINSEVKTSQVILVDCDFTTVEMHRIFHKKCEKYTFLKQNNSSQLEKEKAQTKSDFIKKKDNAEWCFAIRDKPMIAVAMNWVKPNLLTHNAVVC